MREISNAMKDYKMYGEKRFMERALDEKFEYSPTRFKFFHTNKASSTGSHRHLHSVERQPEGVQVVEGVGLRLLTNNKASLHHFRNPAET